MNWKTLFDKLRPQLPYAAIVLALVAWFASYTAKQREIGALHVSMAIDDSVIRVSKDSVLIERRRADRSTHAADSLGALLGPLRARAQRSDSTSRVVATEWRTFRDDVLHRASDDGAVPTPRVIIAHADTVIRACELARDDCKARADKEQQRGDSARAAAAERTREATRSAEALAASQRNEKRLKDALPSTAGDLARAGRWGAIGAAAVWIACATGVLRCGR
jgi:hypothetical protein